MKISGNNEFCGPANKGESIVKFHSLRSFLAAVTAIGAALLLGSCGGGGAGGNPNQGGPLIFQPSGDNVTIYAGIPFTFQLGGGRPPYALTSGDQGILPLPTIVQGHQVTVVANNPGVIDADLQPGELPRRSISIDMRDSTGIFLRSVVQVAQNFLTGYGVRITPTNCPSAAASGADPASQLCPGGESAVLMQATFNGSLMGNRVFRFEVLRGNYSFRHPTTGQAGQSITTNSDHTGTVTAIIQAPPSIGSQLGVMRVTDVASGVYADHVFVISGVSPTLAINPIPNEFTFTGALTTQCGTGTGTFFVFDGVPPYTVASTNPNITFQNTTSNTNPGVFTFTVSNPNVCLSDVPIVVQDSRGGRGTLTVTTEAGTITPTPPAALAVGPSSITLACGQSGSVAVVGGQGGYFATSTSPNVAVVVSGNVLTITRVNSGTSPTSVGIGVSDGRSIVTVSATVPATCP